MSDSERGTVMTVEDGDKGMGRNQATNPERSNATGMALSVDEKTHSERTAQSSALIDLLERDNADQKGWNDALSSLVTGRSIRIAKLGERITQLEQELADEREALGLKNQILHQLNGIQNGAAGQLSRPLRTLEQSSPNLVRKLALVAKLAWWVLSFRLPQRLRMRRQANELLATHLFDQTWYVENNSDVILADHNPVYHWLTCGWREGRDPNPMFDTAWYLEQNPEVAESGMNPLQHYLSIGASHGRRPHPSFDTESYIGKHPEVTELGLNPLVHYLTNVHDQEQAALLEKYYEGLSPSQLHEQVGSDGNVLGQRGLGLIANYRPAKKWAMNSGSFRPEVSVVVPCYNHAAFLRERLDSIYEQSYLPIEVLLLDDCSDDGSQDILREYAERYPEPTTLLFNTQNSGSVFRQWRRGIEAAKSPLVWIAESDDRCDRRFLDTLVPYFADEAIMLAYSHSVFIDDNGKPLEFTFESYTGDLSKDKWDASYVETAHQEVESALGRKNTIPNVSSVVFRRPCQLAMLADSGWDNMHICGDWLFYLHLIRGGKLAYSVDCNNYYRIHTSNTSAATYSTPAYYQEHETIARYIPSWFNVSVDTLTENRQFIERFFSEQGQSLVEQGYSFSDFYSNEWLGVELPHKKPNILIATNSFAVGGGEIFPVRLANALKRKGLSVTFFDYLGGEHNEGMRCMLNSDIPIIQRVAGDGVIAETAKMLDDYGIDVVHSHHANVDQFFAKVKEAANQPFSLVVTMHGMYEAMSDKEFIDTTKIIGDSADAWVYISEKNLVPFRAAGFYSGENFTKIPNGMAMEAVEAVDRSSMGISEDAFVLCLASRAVSEKGWYTAIEAIDALHRISDVDIHLLLLGEGPIYDELRQGKLPPTIHMPGFVDNTIGYYAMADIGLLPSTFKGESFPLTIIECLMAGKPVIASDIGEIRNMITDEEGERAGLLIDVASGAIDVVWLIQKIIALATDKEFYDRKAEIAGKIASRFDMDAVLSQYLDVYTRVVNYTD